MTRFISKIAFFSLITTHVFASNSLNCKDINDAGGFSDLFHEHPYSSELGLSHQLIQARAAVKAFHKDLYKEEMSYDEINELGENLGFSIYTLTLMGNDFKFQAVNVGFGGGNSALILFDIDSTEPNDLYFMDFTDCLLLSESFN